jgi:hypothetical protein
MKKEIESDAHDLLDISPSNFYRELDKAQDVKEIKRLRDMASAVLQYAKSIKMSLEYQNKAAEAKIWAEYKAGKLLLNMNKMDGGDAMRKLFGTNLDYTMEPSSLKDIGIDKHQSMRWQQLARLPEDKLREWISETKEKKELTSSAALQLARDFGNEKLPWDQPVLTREDLLGMKSDLFLAVLCQTIMDCAENRYGDEPKEWILEGLIEDDDPGDCKIFCERFGIPFNTLCDWVLSGCSTKPTHEVLIDMIKQRYEGAK